MARLGTVWPGTKFRLETRGRASPAGQAANHPPPAVLVTVRLRTTAETPVAGRPPRAVAWRGRGAPGPRARRAGAVAGVEDAGRRDGVEPVARPAVPAGDVGDDVDGAGVV